MYHATFTAHDDATLTEMAALADANRHPFCESIETIVSVCRHGGYEAIVRETDARGDVLGFVDCEGTWHPEAGQCTS